MSHVNAIRLTDWGDIPFGELCVLVFPSCQSHMLCRQRDTLWYSNLPENTLIVVRPLPLTQAHLCFWFQWHSETLIQREVWSCTSFQLHLIARAPCCFAQRAFRRRFFFDAPAMVALGLGVIGAWSSTLIVCNIISQAKIDNKVFLTFLVKGILSLHYKHYIVISGLINWQIFVVVCVACTLSWNVKHHWFSLHL